VIYRAYGFTLSSAVALPTLSLFSPDGIRCDIHIEFGAAPGWVNRAWSLPSRILRTRRGGEADPQFALADYGNGCFFQLCYGDGTRFVVDEHATRIWAENGPGLTYQYVTVYLLGPVMGFVLRRRGRTPLHASALAFAGRAVALLGSAGAGKSTTAAALALRGWPVLCEDVCALEESEEGFLVLPAYPRVCLWPDSVNYLFSSSDALPRIVEGWEKRYLPLDGERAQFASDKLPLAAIYLLASRSDENSAPMIEPMSQREAALYLVQNTYMNWLLNVGQRAAEFDAIAKLVSQVEFFQVTPNSDPALLGELAALIESHATRHSRLRPHQALTTARSNV